LDSSVYKTPTVKYIFNFKIANSFKAENMAEGKSRITVVGSSNTDMVVVTGRLPKPGETLLGGRFLMNAGGKGANQAVAAARLGGSVSFVAKTGNDVFGHQARQLFQKEGINTTKFFTDNENPSGVALINVDEQGENCIAVAPGANDNLTIADIDEAREIILGADIVLIQLEIPMETVMHVVDMVSRAYKKVILNPAPARNLPEDIYRRIFAITPNETEAELLTGIKVYDETSAEKAAEIFVSRGVRLVIITMGSKGAYVYQKKDGMMIAAPEVKAVDTTAAGDVFNGALCVALAEEMDLNNAVTFANKAAAISVTRLGAQASAPFRREMG
jgi:ribokinase